MYKLTSF